MRYVTLCFFLFAFTTYFQLPFTHAQPVYDVNGNYLVTTSRYAILPASSTSGGELKLGKTDNTACNLTILQSYDHVGNGLPLKFTPHNEAYGGLIFTDNDLDIKLDNKPECADSLKWVMVEADDDHSNPWVAIDGIQNYKKLKDGWFVIGITPSETANCLMFCYVLSPGLNECDYVRRENDENGMRLVMGGSSDVFGIVFVNVDAASLNKI